MFDTVAYQRSAGNTSPYQGPVRRIVTKGKDKNRIAACDEIGREAAEGGKPMRPDFKRPAAS
jgi:hypothetical protein